MTLCWGMVICVSLLLCRNNVSEWNFMRSYNTFSILSIYLKLSRFLVNIWNRDVIIRGFHLDVVTSQAWFIPEWWRSSDCLPKRSQTWGLPSWKRQCLSLCEIQISGHLLSDLTLSKTQDNVRHHLLFWWRYVQLLWFSYHKPCWSCIILENHDLFTFMY